MNITVDKKDAVLAAAIDAERYPVCHMGKKCISKLTQDLILSSNGVGFVLRNFSLKLILQRYATKRTSLRRNSHHLSLNE